MMNAYDISNQRHVTLYRVIYKSVKQFKNAQQIDYATDRGNSYADRERNSPSFFLHISQVLNVSTFGNTANIYAIVHLVPHASACGTRWTIAMMSAVLPKVDTLRICEICKKNLGEF